MGNNETAAYYDQRTNDYRKYWGDFHFGLCENPLRDIFDRQRMLVLMSDAVIKRLGDISGETILDLGCGIGNTAIRLLQKNPKVGKVIGLTISPVQSQIGPDTVLRAGLSDRIEIGLGDYADIRLPSLSIGGAYALESACYAHEEDKGDLVREVSRVLKPDARFVVADGFRKHSLPLNPFLQKCYDQWCLGWKVPHLADIHKFAECLEKSGFKDIKVEEISWKVAPSVFHAMGMATWYLTKNTITKNRKALTEGSSDAISAFLTGILGANRKDFGYYIISAVKA